MMEFLKAIRDSEAVYRLGWALLHTLWLAAAVAAALAVMLWILRRRSPNARYLTACAALVLVAALSVGTYFLVPGPVSAPKPDDGAVGAAGPIEPTFAPPEAAMPLETDHPLPAPPDVTAPGKGTPDAPLLTRASQMLEPALSWIVLAWAAGACALSLRQLGGWIAAGRLKRLARPPGHPDLMDTVARLTRAVGVSRPVRLLESVLVRVPAVVGWLRPVILLPTGLAAGLAPEHLEAILAHELAHIRRWDYLVNLFQSLVETLLFYHPAVWFVSRRIRAERENCCDDIVVAAGAERLSYAESLLRVAQRSSASGTRGRMADTAAVAATGRPSQLRSRVGRLLRGRDEKTTRLARSWPVALVFLAAILVPTALFVNVRAEPAGPREESTPPATRPAREESKEALQARIAKLVERLASVKFEEREQARKELVKIGLPAVDALQAAATGKDLERAGRAKAALAEIRRHVPVPTNSVVEWRLKSPAVEPRQAFVDLDTGQIVPVPAVLDMTDRKAVWEWARSAGVDAVADTSQGVRGLLGFELVVAKMRDADWDAADSRSIAVNAIGKRMFSDFKMPSADPFAQQVVTANTISTSKDISRTYAFRTRERATGLLQLLEVNDEPGGMIRFRYKVLTRPGGKAASQPSTRPDESPATPATTAPARASASVEVLDEPGKQAKDSMTCVLCPNGRLWLQISHFKLDERGGEIHRTSGKQVRIGEAGAALTLAIKVATKQDRVISHYRLARWDRPVAALSDTRIDDAGSRDGVPRIVFNRQLDDLTQDCRVLWQVRYYQADRPVSSYVCLARVVPGRPSGDLSIPTEEQLLRALVGTNMPATQPAQKATFGPAIERAILSKGLDTSGLVFMDMESGNMLQPPFPMKVDDRNAHFIELTDKLKKWIETNKIDAVIHVRPGGFSMMGLQMRNGHLQPAEWKTVTPADVHARYEKKYPPSRVSGYVPFSFHTSGYDAGCFWFRTREGTIGVLNYRGIKGPEAGLKLECRLSNTQSTGTEAATPPATGGSAGRRVALS